MRLSFLFYTEAKAKIKQEVQDEVKKALTINAEQLELSICFVTPAAIFELSKKFQAADPTKTLFPILQLKMHGLDKNMSFGLLAVHGNGLDILRVLQNW